MSCDVFRNGLKLYLHSTLCSVVCVRVGLTCVGLILVGLDWIELIWVELSFGVGLSWVGWVLLG